MALVAPLFFLCLLGSIDAALWALQTSAAVSSVEQAARLAAAASGSPESDASPTPHQLLESVRSQLQQGLFATTVVAWCEPGHPDVCPTAAGASGLFARCPTDAAVVEARFGPRAVAICDQLSPPSPRCPPPPLPATPRCGDPPMVTVRVIGYSASLVPPLLGLGWRGGEIPMSIEATTHTLRFAP